VLIGAAASADCAAAAELPAPQRPAAPRGRRGPRIDARGADGAVRRRRRRGAGGVPRRRGAAETRPPTRWRAASACSIQLQRDELFDVAVVGAGPAGLATAVYAASKGCTWS
jgi:hypothetical protein